MQPNVEWLNQNFQKFHIFRSLKLQHFGSKVSSYGPEIPSYGNYLYLPWQFLLFSESLGSLYFSSYSNAAKLLYKG